MFNFFSMAGNYEDRKVGRDEFPWGFISTARVTDGDHPYETAVSHDRYCKDGKMVIVEAYDSKADALTGHAKWVKTMTAKKLPEKLTDCYNSGVSKLITTFGGKIEKKRQPAKRKAA